MTEGDPCNNLWSTNDSQSYVLNAKDMIMIYLNVKCHI